MVTRLDGGVVMGGMGMWCCDDVVKMSKKSRHPFLVGNPRDVEFIQLISYTV